MWRVFKSLISAVRRLKIQIEHGGTLLHVEDRVKDVHVWDLEQLLDKKVYVNLVLLDALPRMYWRLSLGRGDVG